MSKRREFVLKMVPLAGALAVLPRVSFADAPPAALTETDPMALAMGFHLETANANQAKYPKHANDQVCSKCLHYATPAADSAVCDLFKKTVPKGGWCSGFSKRP